MESLNIFSFECFRCGVCCVKFQAPLTHDEVCRLSAFLSIDPEDFIREYTDPRWPGKERLLLPREGACPFLFQDRSKKITRCRVHPVRPAACRDWEAGPDKRECRDGIFQYWGLNFGENGNVEGTPGDIRAFQSFMNSLRENDIRDE